MKRGLYQRIEELLTPYVLTAMSSLPTLLTAVATWYEIYYVIDDSTTETIKAISGGRSGGSVAIGILVSRHGGYSIWCFHKLILEKYLENRFNDGLAKGEVRGREKGRIEGREEGMEEAYDKLARLV